MPLTLDDFHNFIKEIETLQRLNSKDEGVLSQMMKELREKYRCKTTEEAKRRIKEAQDERQGYLVKYNRMYRKVRKDLRKYKRFLKRTEK